MELNKDKFRGDANLNEGSKPNPNVNEGVKLFPDRVDLDLGVCGGISARGSQIEYLKLGMALTETTLTDSYGRSPNGLIVCLQAKKKIEIWT